MATASALPTAMVTVYLADMVGVTAMAAVTSTIRNVAMAMPMATIHTATAAVAPVTAASMEMAVAGAKVMVQIAAGVRVMTSRGAS